MSNFEKILFIENEISWFKNIKAILNEFDDKHDIQMVDIEEFMTSYRSNESFNSLRYCFVDLELGPGTDRSCNDTLGLDHVLPKIRSLAPWIPTACISRHITGEETILRLLSVSDFDGIYPKKIISTGNKIHPDFNKTLWNSILLDLRIKRVAAMTGRTTFKITTLLEKSKNVELRLSDNIRKIVDGIGTEQFQEGIALLELGGTTLIISEITGGYSGINVWRIEASDSGTKGLFRSHWLIKWGADIIKLDKEIQAHYQMLQRGINRSLQVPLLHHNVVAWSGIGYIAYVFEKDAQTALEFIRKNNVEKFTKHIEKIVKFLYSTDKNFFDPIKELKRWCDFNVENNHTTHKESLQRQFELTGALIHGDLHLRNILIKDNMPVLIDFARSDYAPIALDTAKLVIDILVFSDVCDLDEISLDWNSLSKSPLKGILNAYKEHLNSDDNKTFFDLAIKEYAHKYTTYPDVSDDKKGALKRLLDKKD
ncbi:MAG: aminoglycoside phosphotransferase family protein [Nitrospirae bacterium]|nr:aminoglycoside phosphotransferase family protein [Nitrospirota bacterium]